MVSATTIRGRVLLAVLAGGYGKFAVAATQLALVPVLTLAWGLPRYGQWLLLATVPMFLAASDFGFSTAAGVRIIGEVARGEHAEALLTYRSARALIVRLSAGAFVVAAAIALMLPAHVLETPGGMSALEARLVLVLMCGYGLLTIQATLFYSIARSAHKTAQIIGLDGTVILVEGLAVMATARAGGGPLGAALAFVVVRSLGVCWARAYAHRVAPWASGARLRSRMRVRELWRPAIAAMVLPLAQAAYLQGSALAIGAAIGASSVPVYTTLRTLSRIGFQVLSVLLLPLMPEYTAAHARGDIRKTAIISGGLVMANLAGGVIYAAVLAIFGMPLLALWTKGVIRPPQAMITLTALGLAMSVMWNLLSNLLLAINRHERVSYMLTVFATASIALTFVFVRAFGVTGAAAANLVMEVGMLVTTVLSLRRHAGRIMIGRETLDAVLPPGWRARLSSAIRR